MAVQCDFAFARYEDGTLSVTMKPPVPITNWSIQFDIMKRFGGESLVNKMVASGYNGTSGITVVNEALGVFNISLSYDVDMSGFQYGNYAYQSRRTDSGGRSIITEGYMSLTP